MLQGSFGHLHYQRVMIVLSLDSNYLCLRDMQRETDTSILQLLPVHNHI